VEGKQRCAETNPTRVTVVHFSTSHQFGKDCHPTPEAGLAPDSKAFPHLSSMDGRREGRGRNGAPKGRTAVVSNRFALIPHFTTTKITSNSY